MRAWPNIFAAIRSAISCKQRRDQITFVLSLEKLSWEEPFSPAPPATFAPVAAGASSSFAAAVAAAGSQRRRRRRTCKSRNFLRSSLLFSLKMKSHSFLYVLIQTESHHALDCLVNATGAGGGAALMVAATAAAASPHFFSPKLSFQQMYSLAWECNREWIGLHGICAFILKGEKCLCPSTCSAFIS